MSAITAYFVDGKTGDECASDLTKFLRQLSGEKVLEDLVLMSDEKEQTVVADAILVIKSCFNHNVHLIVQWLNKFQIKKPILV